MAEPEKENSPEQDQENRYLALTAPLRIIFAVALSCFSLFIPVACFTIIDTEAWKMLDNVWSLLILGIDFILFLITIDPLYRFYADRKNTYLILMLMIFIVVPSLNLIGLLMLSPRVLLPN